ncbi:ornithine carbamoyltransferase [Alphaproteobacteria bacterium]|nr:ornithine carbamoyltransferase [Alphaproteobacteria bacterium]
MMKHFIDLDNFTKTELKNILSFATKIKKNQKKYSNILNNKSLGLLFEKESTRTRVSFNIGMQKLGGNVIELDSEKIGFGKRESISDVLQVLSQYIDVLMIRNNSHNELVKCASYNKISIINGLSNYSHPCQVLSDIFTITEKFGKIENKQITWLGDFNNVLTSLIQAAEIFNFKLNILLPKEIEEQAKMKIGNKNLLNSNFCYNFDKALKNSDCVMTDTWISMGEKKSKSKIKLLQKFQVNDMIMNKAKKNAIFMHCLPAHRNEEVTDSVIDSNKSLVWGQARNRMYVQQSILYYLFKDVRK